MRTRTTVFRGCPKPPKIMIWTRIFPWRKAQTCSCRRRTHQLPFKRLPSVARATSNLPKRSAGRVERSGNGKDLAALAYNDDINHEQWEDGVAVALRKWVAESEEAGSRYRPLPGMTEWCSFALLETPDEDGTHRRTVYSQTPEEDRDGGGPKRSLRELVLSSRTPSADVA